MNERLFIFTASGSEAYQHYIDTIENGFTLDSIRNYLSEKDQKNIELLYGEELIRAWGATPGVGNIPTWEKLRIGDPILIYREKNFEYYAFVTYKAHNRDLARNLWGENAQGETWEYVYFLDNLTELSVPVEVFNEILGYRKNYIPQGFGSIKEERVSFLSKEFGSIENFLNYLAEGRWVGEKKLYPEEIRQEIVKERVSKQIGKTKILEANLENFIAERVNQIEAGLKIIDRQLDTKEVGRMDLLCEDTEGSLVVVELKRFKATSSIIDQIQRYMGWVMEHRAKSNQKVRGIIIVGSKDTALEYAVKANPLVSVKVFTVSFQ